MDIPPIFNPSIRYSTISLSFFSRRAPLSIYFLSASLTISKGKEQKFSPVIIDDILQSAFAYPLARLSANPDFVKSTGASEIISKSINIPIAGLTVTTPFNPFEIREETPEV